MLRVFDEYRYASSMYRGEDKAAWLLFQRKKLDQAHFVAEVRGDRVIQAGP